MIITLCGSARFEDAFHYWNEQLTMCGHIVIGLSIYPSNKGGKKDWYDANTKQVLDYVHLLKVDAANLVLVIDQEVECGDLFDSYVGESTEREVARAISNGTPVHFTSVWQRTIPADLRQMDLPFRFLP
jgi:hypothetical protein